MKQQLQSLTTEELEQRLRLRFLTRSRSDKAFFDLVAEVLAERETVCPDGHIRSADEAWDAVMAKYRAEVDAGNRAAVEAGAILTQESGRRRRKRPVARRLAAVAAVAAALALALVVVQAAGVDIFGSIGRWTESVFHFEPPTESTAEIDVELMQVDESTVLPALREAFAACEIPLSLAPRNIPDGVQVSEITTSSTNSCNILFFKLHYPDEIVFVFSVAKLADHALTAGLREKSPEIPVEYSHAGRLFYIFENNGTFRATWTDGRYEVLIQGGTSGREIRAVIDLT